jgi:hypothetical protein
MFGSVSCCPGTCREQGYIRGFRRSMHMANAPLETIFVMAAVAGVIRALPKRMRTAAKVVVAVVGVVVVFVAKHSNPPGVLIGPGDEHLLDIGVALILTPILGSMLLELIFSPFKQGTEAPRPHSDTGAQASESGQAGGDRGRQSRLSASEVGTVPEISAEPTRQCNICGKAAEP